MASAAAGQKKQSDKREPSPCLSHSALPQFMSPQTNSNRRKSSPLASLAPAVSAVREASVPERKSLPQPRREPIPFVPIGFGYFKSRPGVVPAGIPRFFGRILRPAASKSAPVSVGGSPPVRQLLWETWSRDSGVYSNSKVTRTVDFSWILLPKLQVKGPGASSFRPA